MVVGIEADAQYTDFGNKTRTVNGTFSPVVGGLNGTTAVRLPGNEMNFFGTVRGRIGYAFDRTLVYGTGGFAYGDGGTGSDDFRTGYTAGGGIEYALPTDSFFNFFKSSAVTLKVEGLYVNLEQDGRGNRSVYNPTTNVLSLSPSASRSRVRRGPRRPELQVRLVLGLTEPTLRLMAEQEVSQKEPGRKAGLFLLRGEDA